MENVGSIQLIRGYFGNRQKLLNRGWRSNIRNSGINCYITLSKMFALYEKYYLLQMILIQLIHYEYVPFKTQKYMEKQNSHSQTGFITFPKLIS